MQIVCDFTTKKGIFELQEKSQFSDENRGKMAKLRSIESVYLHKYARNLVLMPEQTFQCNIGYFITEQFQHITGWSQNSYFWKIMLSASLPTYYRLNPNQPFSKYYFQLILKKAISKFYSHPLIKYKE